MVDQKTPTNLDPKLKEAYDRVMGTLSAMPTAPSSPTPIPVAPSPMSPPTPPTPTAATMPQEQPTPIAAPFPQQAPVLPVPQPVAAVSFAPLPIAPAAQTAQSTPVPIPITPSTPSQANTNAQPAGTTFVAKGNKKGLHIPPVLIALGVVVFFIGYAAFWIFFFKVKVPFLP